LAIHTAAESPSSSAGDHLGDETLLNEKHLPPRQDIVKKLRERNQPIRLFGESDLDSYKRLRLLETIEPELRGQRNDFKAAMDKIDREYLSLILHANNPSSSSSSSEPVEEDTAESSATAAVVVDEGYDLNDIIEQIKTTRKGNRSYDCQVVLNYFKFILKKMGQRIEFT